MARRVKRQKRRLVKQFGGACQRCGYSKSLRALHFHHIDSSEKEEWSNGRGHSSFREIRNHPERFELLCANCHAEVHERIARKRKPKVECQQCGREFVAQRYRIQMGKEKFCSQECAWASYETSPYETAKERLLKHTDRSGDCWLWTASKNGPYGQIGVKGDDGEHKVRLAHRVSWRVHFGPIPENRVVVQTCGIDHCVNPDHLALVTKGEAMQGKAARTNMRLTEAQVVEIRNRYPQGGHTYKSLGQEYGVAATTIADIIKGRTWKHLLD